MDGHGC
jgi:hypothetical protein